MKATMFIELGESPSGAGGPSTRTAVRQPNGRWVRISRDSAKWLWLAAAMLAVDLCRGSAKAQVAGSIEVYPANSSIESNGSRQFSAYVPISPNTVTWLVNDVPGGGSTFGAISSSGLYQAPAVIPVQNVVVIKARSTAFPASVGSATLTITKPYPWLWSVSPSKLTTGNYQVSFNGSNFKPDSQALANGSDIPTTYISSTKLIASGAAQSAGTIQFAVRQPGPGAVTGNSVTVQVAATAVSVAVAPSTATLQLGASLPFTATVAGSPNTLVNWSVNGVEGGSSTYGMISASGMYATPTVLPASSTVIIRATSVANPASFGQAAVTLTPPPPPVTVSLAPSTASTPLGATQTFAATVAGSANTSLSWSVNGIPAGSAEVGTVSSGGVYSAPVVMPASSIVTIRATSAANPASFAEAVVTLASPPPPSVWLDGARFLEQSSFGPTPATLAAVAQMGIPAYLEAQFGMPETAIPTPSANSMSDLRQWALHHYSTAPDQLRQRVAYSLSQIVVTSANKLIYPDAMLPWLRILSQHAFGNYRDLLRDVTMSPSMGKYLDLANSVKPGPTGGANENYARELMQLFTIGLWMLHQDGSPVLDAAGQPVSSYGQETVAQVSLALTGWTYATAPGATPQNLNWEYFGAPMEPRQQNHAMSSKNFLGCFVPAGQTVIQDLDSLLDCLMTHQNTAPFVATRLIRGLVMSNPSPGYIQRVADVFVNNGAGVRGDLRAVVTAILLDSEARQDIPQAHHGRLKEPILHLCGFLRALNGHFTSAQQLTYLFDYMAQPVLSPASVFSWFSPLYRIPASFLFGPEFQIYTPTEATLRGNFFHMILHNPGSDMVVDLSSFQPYGNDMAGLVEAVNATLLYGRMPSGMKQALITAAAPGYDAKTRIETVLYLTALSGLYAVQY